MGYNKYERKLYVAEQTPPSTVEIFDNVNKKVRDDLENSIKKGSKLSIAGACFSIYAYNELKKQLNSIDELRFIFTAPTFISDKQEKQKREFHKVPYPISQSYLDIFNQLWNKKKESKMLPMLY